MKKLRQQSQLTNYDLVFLPGLKQIPAGFGEGLSRFVRTGGGLVLFLNDNVSLAYNSELGDVLPAQLGPVQRNLSGAAGLKWHLDEYDVRSEERRVGKSVDIGGRRL